MPAAPEPPSTPGEAPPVAVAQKSGQAECGRAASDADDRRWSPGPRQRSALISWAGFVVTFVAVRALTHAIRRGSGPTGDVTVGGVHIHHYLWGILLLGASGGVAVHGPDRFRSHPVLAIAYGAGGALVIDEFAVLVHLQDVYWKSRGKHSVLLAVGLICGTGASFLGIPIWRKHVMKHR